MTCLAVSRCCWTWCSSSSTGRHTNGPGRIGDGIVTRACGCARGLRQYRWRRNYSEHYWKGYHCAKPYFLNDFPTRHSCEPPIRFRGDDEQSLGIQLIDRKPDDVVVNGRVELFAQPIVYVGYCSFSITRLPYQHRCLIKAKRFISFKIINKKFAVDFLFDKILFPPLRSVFLH